MTENIIVTFSQFVMFRGKTRALVFVARRFL